MSRFRTRVCTEGANSLLCRGLRVKVPSFICLGIGGAAALERHFILAGNGLTVKDEERDHVVAGPKIEILFNMRVDASQAAEGREERFVSGRVIENLAEVVAGVDADGAIIEIGQIERTALC